MSMVVYQNLIRWFLLGVLSFMLVAGKLAFAGQSPEQVGAMLKAMADPAGAPSFPSGDANTPSSHMGPSYALRLDLCRWPYLRHIRLYTQRGKPSKACKGYA